MKSFIAILALVAVAAADVSHLTRSSEADAQITFQDAEVLPDRYQYKFQTSNGISAQESGALKNVGREGEAIEVQGSNQYTGTDGKLYETVYISNENGYQPQGAHLPTPPPPQPIPDYILKALEYIKNHPSKENN